MTNKITCPKCGEEIDIENLIQAGAKDALDKQLALQRSEFDKKLEQALQEQKAKQLEREQDLKKKILSEQEEANKELERELQEKSEQIKELNKLKVEKLRLEREKNELKETLQAENEREFNQRLIEERQKLQKSAEEKFELQIAELKKQLEDQKNLTEEMKKRQEQGSMQLQGEVQELAIEKYLKETFRYDEILEIKKGDMGADSVQIVNTPYRQNCGSIYYESKRTKIFKDDWIAKFKDDIQSKGADIGVLVTAVYPKDMTRMGLRDGIYICTYEEFKALSGILREALIKISDTKSMQENKHEKSAVLYNYLTSTEFRFQIETIVNAFVSLQQDLDSEKRAMNKIWKKREKEIQNVISATTDMYGSIQAIAGNAVKPVEALEFPLLETNEMI
ncbi:DUF2130 domain-containing protein [bacterium]|nr:DUF2130 domain-containing protein [bacterium]